MTITCLGVSDEGGPTIDVWEEAVWTRGIVATEEAIDN